MTAGGFEPITADLSGVPETMLWALHNRATEAARPDRILTDPDSINIHRRIDYDYDRHFGTPAGALAARAASIDVVLKRWIAKHPRGTIVSLGEGLETQSRRVDNGKLRWLSIDLPEAIAIRERFLPPTSRFRHIAICALDHAWMDAVEPDAEIFIVAQGLLMYLEPERLRSLFAAIAGRFPKVEMIFDVVPRWFSHLTLMGFQQTPHYRLPPMPWGIDRDEIEPTMRAWAPGIETIERIDYRVPRGLPHYASIVIGELAILRQTLPTLVHLTTGAARQPATTHTSRKQPMPSLNDVLQAARRTAQTGSDISSAAGQVIAKRTAMGVAATLHPLAADHTEFGRILPEKLEAFAASGMIMARHAGEAGGQLGQFAGHALTSAAEAALAIATSGSIAAMVETQARFVSSWMETVTSNVMSLGLLAVAAQDAAMVPIHRTVAANVERLGC